jgi:hypothetical protein
VKLEETIDYPQEWPRLGDSLMTNLDHEVDEKVAAELKQVQAVANYPGWNFHATCWWDGARGMYLAAVRCYRSLRGTYAAATPKELMDEISGVFGHD